MLKIDKFQQSIILLFLSLIVIMIYATYVILIYIYMCKAEIKQRL